MVLARRGARALGATRVAAPGAVLWWEGGPGVLGGGLGDGGVGRGAVMAGVSDYGGGGGGLVTRVAFWEFLALGSGGC